jgi:glycosyltransferase involved in cell wall biosynthesis
MNRSGTVGPADLSVLTPSLGYARFIQDAIESVRRQEGMVIEHIVQDGGSTDGTVELLRQSDGLIWKSEPDQGQSDALNKALTLAGGRWIAWLNADEFYVPGGLQALVAEGDRTGADLVYGDTVFVDAGGRLTRLLPQHSFSSFVLRSYGPFISTVSAIFRRSTLGNDPIDPTFRRMMDWDLYLRMDAAGADIAYTPVPVGVFRAHGGRITADERRGFFQRLNKEGGFGREYAILRERYGALRFRRVGHLLHGLMKLSAASYRRQLAARGFKGADLRWFSSPEAAKQWNVLRARCYGAD